MSRASSGTAAAPPTERIGAAPSTARRIVALDGLRGAAAAVVVVFHFLCMFHHDLVPDMTATPPWLADTPLGLLWNGPFAVSIFFVLSGFVIAAAASRRRALPISNLVTRHLRLALPVTASVLFAWGLLNAFPAATRALAEAAATPSPWWAFTLQDPIPGLPSAVYEGMVRNFIRGYSVFNNVLWTMQIELTGSVGLFVLYWATEGRVRLALLVLGAGALIALSAAHYLGFALGALLHEAWRRDLLARAVAVPSAALILGVVLGAPGAGWADRMAFGWAPTLLAPGVSYGFAPVIAAALIVYAALTLPALIRALSGAVPRWLGRVSFGLYLVHVPPLYTLAAWAHGAGAPVALIAPIYGVGVLALAHLFTLAVDEPTLRGLDRIRRALAPLDRAAAPAGRGRPGG